MGAGVGGAGLQLAVESPWALAAVVLGGLIGLGLLAVAVVSWREEEPRAVRVSLVLAVVLSLPYLVAGLVVWSGQAVLAGVLIGVTVLVAVAAAVVLLVPVGRSRVSEESTDDSPTERIDERTIMFSRVLLKPGSERAEEYYRTHPEHRAPDDRFRSRPGLMQPGSTQYDPVMFAAADASFAAVAQFHGIVEDREWGAEDSAAASADPSIDPAMLTGARKERFDPDPAEMTRFVKAWAHKLGAVACGVTELRDEHYYTMVGRGPQWGDAVQREHRFGIVIAVEMDKAALDRAPAGPTLMESAQQYLESGAVAVQLTELCRNLGWPARAHIDGNYRVVCPLVARDADLGEIGRMGLLMTPRLGPRVRLAVVTTDLPLVAGPPRREPATLDFCRICKKCAEVCPAQAIPVDDARDIGGVRRWQIDQEACFTYWCAVGTDCGRCVAVCPYSHPDNALHAVVRWAVARSALFRPLALRLDDLFCGRRPAALALEEWQGVGEKRS